MSVFAALRDAFLPPRCPGCGDPGDDARFCELCVGKIRLRTSPMCLKCGARIPPATMRRECHLSSFALFVAGEYASPPLQRAIWHLKFRNARRAAEALGNMLADFLEPYLENGKCCFVPVPLGIARERARGYNQAALIARVLGKKLNMPVLENILLRERETLPQHESRSASERRANVANGFILRKEAIIPHSQLILVDDVVTTGATLEAAGRALRSAGARGVWCAAVART